jgi:hypothetical protein
MTTNLKELCMKRESRAFHIEDTYDSSRKNASSRVSENHMRASTPPLMVKNGPVCVPGVDRPC